jgi:CRISPR-associated protein Csb2
MILQLTIRLLDNRYHGRADGGEPEWPPSPFRVFQALLAGAKSHWSDERAGAFAWLESLPPPVIHAPPIRPGNRLLVWVPNNDPNHQRTQRVIQPRILPAEVKERSIDYFWTVHHPSTPARRHAEIIAQCARHVRCLGWGIDMAIGTGQMIEALPDPESSFLAHIPAEATRGGSPLRVPCKGSLQSLERAHEAALNRIRRNPDTGKQEMHDDPGNKQFDIRIYGTSPTRPFCAFNLCRPDDDEETLSFNPRQIKSLVGMIRGLMNSKRVHDAFGKDKVDRTLLGHPKDYSGPRLSIMPLLSIGHPHSDTRIRRVILAEPFGGNGEVCHQLAEIFNNKDLVPDESDKPAVRLRRLSQNDRYIRKWYAGCARQWASVSPVLLPGFDHPRSNNGAKAIERAEKLVHKALHQADIPLPCRIEISPISWWPGVPHARGFVPRDKLGPAPRYHVKLTFDHRFTGPLSLGRQRHTGLGVFAAIQDI